MEEKGCQSEGPVPFGGILDHRRLHRKALDCRSSPFCLASLREETLLFKAPHAVLHENTRIAQFPSLGDWISLELILLPHLLKGAEARAATPPREGRAQGGNTT